MVGAGLWLALAVLQNDKAQANGYDDAWEQAWVNHCRTVYTTTGKTTGFVLQVGDSITHSNPYSQWPRYGAGQTAEDQALVAWCMATSWGAGNSDTANKNGWYLAAADTSGTRGMTAASGISTDEYLSGNGNGGTAMPLTGNTATAQGYVADGATYTANLQIDTVAAAFADAQFAVLMLGTNDVTAGRLATDFIADLTALVDILEAANIVVILSTIPPYQGQTATVDAYNVKIRAFAQSRGLPLIDYHAEIMARDATPFDSLISNDGIHPSASAGGYGAADDPYTPGGDPATHTTGTAALNSGYLLRSWLTVQKLKEVKDYVADGHDPPAGGGGGGGGGGGAGAPAVRPDGDDDSCGCRISAPPVTWGWAVLAAFFAAIILPGVGRSRRAGCLRN